ncbi:hypothetical protein LJR129_004945 [Acidovorax sp. LjRoot129]|uniref:hypothetical protein n=1 Tax=unclassified Acidovorax TaxID=2684926 RepID=UPI003ECDBD84
MDEIRDAIRVLAKHKYRSMSNVVGEFIEREVALVLEGVQASHCMKGFDVMTKEQRRVEVKSRNAEAKSWLCQLPAHKVDAMDDFVLAIVREGEIEKVLLFRKETLLSLRGPSGMVYIDKGQHGHGEDITHLFRTREPISEELAVLTAGKAKNTQ